ncbi:hypothetical protein [Aridibaculum aurantiacum]|uniref:hypothetical protein n=1 Tax=Aridibaculum aurantiacum TaxID=2810307 RepID=UPI001A95C294|nr:hypothetical protein [Aridibaculum aurantiacum]
MHYICLSDFVYDCQQCHTRCDGISKGVYNFQHDVSFSEGFEQMIIERINRSGKYHAAKSLAPGYPDVEISSIDGQVQRYLEVKVQKRTFMQVKKYLPASDLCPSETVALNESDLVRYFDIYHSVHIPVVVVWVLLNRLCIVPEHYFRLYFQDVRRLEEIYKKYGDTRRFRRKSGEGDVVEGVHKGVTVNYHFSLKELKGWNF